MMMSSQNPLGLDGFEFAEFTSPEPSRMAALFEQLGFTAASTHPARDLVRYKQGRINLLLNRDPRGQAADFRAAHGPSANGMAFRVADAEAAFRAALARGATAADASRSALAEGAYVLEGIGGSNLYLVDRYAEAGSLYDGWDPVPGAAEAEAANSVGLDLVDHLTHNVRRGRMQTWSAFYREVFGFDEQKDFDVRGRATGLIAPDGVIRIRLDESRDDESRIEEFLRQHNGEGVQRLALATHDIETTVERLRARGVRLQDRSEALFGPIFFEIVQRKGVQGFGDAALRALFASIEPDQIRRGVITAERVG